MYDVAFVGSWVGRNYAAVTWVDSICLYTQTSKVLKDVGKQQNVAFQVPIRVFAQWLAVKQVPYPVGAVIFLLGNVLSSQLIQNYRETPPSVGSLGNVQDRRSDV